MPGFEKPYSLTEVGIPIGGGIRLQLSKHVTMSFEVSARKLFTDYLDDVSSTQFLYNDIKRGNGTLAAKLSLPGFEENGLAADTRKGPDRRVYAPGDNRLGIFKIALGI